ncbi:GNAT family N-acetyltransferase [Paenibacillus donghaensis]|uniref:GNAT family N-acetyltransferase n=1 Tax=Paenibacillus donghaensis TaxID=414771 RepID=UPI0018835248|nr:GNAT family N-acetyltransferase [Paenibacillus donghaensis]MBE9915134.1 GNAT family N-acetyltransferase [Paenibacillus donghaensis]
MLIREIEEKDNKQVEDLIRTCLIEFGANKPGTAWTDPNLGDFYNLYKSEGSKYWVVEENAKIVAGCGIGPVEGLPDICELQKMYALKEARGTGISKELLGLALDFAKKYYKQCYLETFNNMIAANKFYKKNGFMPLEKPLNATEHFACDAWYIKTL